MINSNKNAFLVHIYNIFGCAFDKRMLLPYTLFISSLCFDSSLQGSPDDILLLSIINELKTKPMTIEEISRETNFVPIDHENVLAELNRITSHIDSINNIYRLTDDSKWHPFFAFLPLSKALNSITAFAQRNKISPLPIPEPVCPDILKTPFFYAIVYLMLNENEICQRIAMSLLIAASKMPRKEDSSAHEIILNENITKETIGLGSIAENIAKLLTGDFFEFINTPIAIKEGDNPKTPFELMCSFGALGENCLERMNINFIPQQNTTNMKKAAAKEMKKRMLEQFKQAQDNFTQRLGSDLGEEQELEKCAVCQIDKPEPLCIPVLVFNSNGERILSCLHCIHSSCVKSDQKFICPLDRQKRNGLLPVFTDVLKPSPLEQKAAQHFLLSTFQENPIISCVNCIYNEIRILEMRFRSNPDAIDKYPPNLLKNLFYAAWCSRHLFDMKFKHNGDYLYDSILTALSSDNPQEYLSTITEPSKNLSNCRKVALFKHFVISPINTGDKFMDWDDILSPEKLDAEDTKLSSFELIKLPQDFIEFAREEYGGYDIEKSHTTYLNLLNGSAWDEDDVLTGLITDELTSAPFICLTGRKASTIFIYSTSFPSPISATGIYLDVAGQEVEGFLNNTRLNLSPQRLDMLIEEVLSCSWVRKLK